MRTNTKNQFTNRQIVRALWLAIKIANFGENPDIEPLNEEQLSGSHNLRLLNQYLNDRLNNDAAFNPELIIYSIDGFDVKGSLAHEIRGLHGKITDLQDCLTIPGAAYADREEWKQQLALIKQHEPAISYILKLLEMHPLPAIDQQGCILL